MWCVCVCVWVGGCAGVCVNGCHGTSSLGMTQATCHANKDISDALLWSPVGEPAVQLGKEPLVECQDTWGRGQIFM